LVARISRVQSDESIRIAVSESRSTKTKEGMPHAGQVETYVDQGVEKLSRIRFDSRQIEIAENIDHWHGPDYRSRSEGATATCIRFAITNFAPIGS
jgi:hypothetical protein